MINIPFSEDFTVEFPSQVNSDMLYLSPCVKLSLPSEFFEFGHNIFLPFISQEVQELHV
jgi:hypothetical protein